MIPTIGQNATIIAIAELLKKLNQDDSAAYRTAYFSVMNEWPDELPIITQKTDYKNLIIFGLGVAVLVLFLAQKR